jgi:hypothetical protein
LRGRPLSWPVSPSDSGYATHQLRGQPRSRSTDPPPRHHRRQQRRPLALPSRQSRADRQEVSGDRAPTTASASVHRRHGGGHLLSTCTLPTRPPLTRHPPGPTQLNGIGVDPRAGRLAPRILATQPTNSGVNPCAGTPPAQITRPVTEGPGGWAGLRPDPPSPIRRGLSFPNPAGTITTPTILDAVHIQRRSGAGSVPSGIHSWTTISSPTRTMPSASTAAFTPKLTPPP